MSLIFDRQSRCFTIKARSSVIRAVRGQILKREVRRKRGIPSRSLPSELALQALTLRRGPVAPGASDRFWWLSARYRLLSRSREAKDRARLQRRPSVERTGINLWRRRQEWLRFANR